MQSKAEVEVPVHRHIPALDGVRGFAAMTVFVYHYGGGAQSSFWPARAVGTLIHYAGAGVSLFFVLSGFLISGILWDGYSKPNWWKRFYARRSLRIFPLYYLAILFAAVVWLLSGIAPGTLTPLYLYVLYLGDIPSFGRQFAQLPQTIPLSHLWSLAVEEQFYIFWPFVLALVAGQRGRAKQLILGLWALSQVFRVVMVLLHAPVAWELEFLFGRAGELLAGAYIAMIVRGDVGERESFFRFLPVFLIASLVVLVGLGFLTGGVGFEPPLMATLGIALCSTLFGSVIGTSLRPGATQKFFGIAPLRWLGKISYGIYVYHLLLRTGFVWVTDHLAAGRGTNTRLILLFCVALAGTLGVASLSFYTFESAFLRWKDRVAR